MRVSIGQRLQGNVGMQEAADIRSVHTQGMGMTVIRHRTAQELEAGLEEIRNSPRESGRLEMIVRRPAVGEREILTLGELDLVEGLVGDTWRYRSSSRTADGSAHPDMQINIINARAIALIAGHRDRWPLAGDQFYVDIDLGIENMPPGTQLAMGSAVLVVTDQPHTGCGKFTERFGTDAMKFVNSPLGRRLCLRGINARVLKPGTVSAGDMVRKIERP
ncbi:MAG TPA: MOSC domain-containing protein [Candidatus Kapabacteria bacterium]|nr:MOSC domain-containing protein [Candidatus Kapabacteria bacterium]